MDVCIKDTKEQWQLQLERNADETSIFASCNYLNQSHAVFSIGYTGFGKSYFLGKLDFCR